MGTRGPVQANRWLYCISLMYPDISREARLLAGRWFDCDLHLHGGPAALEPPAAVARDVVADHFEDIVARSAESRSRGSRPRENGGRRSLEIRLLDGGFGFIESH